MFVGRVCQGSPVCSFRDYRLLTPTYKCQIRLSAVRLSRFDCQRFIKDTRPHCPIKTEQYGLCPCVGKTDVSSFERAKIGLKKKKGLISFSFSQKYHCVADSLSLSVCTPLFIVLGRMRIGSQALVALATPV